MALFLDVESLNLTSDSRAHADFIKLSLLSKNSEDALQCIDSVLIDKRFIKLIDERLELGRSPQIGKVRIRSNGLKK